MVLQLRLSRWRCRNRECEQAIFRERLGEVVAPWARRTSRVEEVLLLVGHHGEGQVYRISTELLLSIPERSRALPITL